MHDLSSITVSISTDGERFYVGALHDSTGNAVNLKDFPSFAEATRFAATVCRRLAETFDKGSTQ